MLRLAVPLAVLFASAGCAGDGADNTPSLTMISFAGTASLTLTGEGSAEVEGTLRGVRAEGVQVVVILDDEMCDPDAKEWTTPPYDSTTTIELGNIDGEQGFEATLHSQRGPLEDRFRVWAFATATNLDGKVKSLSCSSL